MPSERPSDGPVRPSASPTLAEFGAALRRLRDTWAGLTQKEVGDRQDPKRTPRLRIQTISDYERGQRQPDWEWTSEFVTVCLAKPKPPHQALTEDQVRAEVAVWMDAWKHTKTLPAAPQPEGPQPPAAPVDTAELPADIASGGLEPAPFDLDTELLPAAAAEDPLEQRTPAPDGAAHQPPVGPPAQSALAENGPAGQPPSGAGPARGRRRGLLVAAAAGAIAAVVVMLAAVFFNGQGARTTENPPAPEAASAPASSAAPTPGAALSQDAQTRDDAVDDLAPSQGYDFDYDVTKPDETVPGMDLSTNKLNSTINSVATEKGGRLVRLPPGANPSDRAACDAIPEGRWAKNVTSVPVGGSVCLRTDEHNLVIFTITKSWDSPTDNTISFRYRIWYH